MDGKKKKVLLVFFYLLLGIALIAAMVFVYPAYVKYQKTKQKVADLNGKYEERSAERVGLLRQVNELVDKPRAAEKVAREKFGLCKNGEVVLKYSDKDVAPDEEKKKRKTVEQRTVEPEK